MRAVLVLGTSLALCACPPPPEPYYDDDIGEEGVPVEEGSLAGTFATKSINAVQITIPIINDPQIGGGQNFRLVERTWDADAGTYLQSSRLCGGNNFEVAGVTTVVPEDMYRAVPKSTQEVLEMDHETGHYVSTGHLQLWALKDLPDPYTTPLPADEEEAMQEPHVSRIFDVDDDGNPGFTTFVEGAVQGEQYVAQRKTIDFDGITKSEDRVYGFAHNFGEILYLGNNNPLLDRRDEGASVPHPDPKESWFEEIRIDDGADCDDVMALAADGTLSRTRPFAR